MTFHIVCRSCGKDNKLGQMFCRYCGNRLTQSSVREVKHSKAGRFMAILCRLSFFVIVVGVLGLLLWTVEPTGREGTEAHAKAFEQKVLRLEDSIEHRYRTEEVFSESQVNAYLARVVEHTSREQDDGGARFQIDEINVSFTPEYATVVIRAEWGPVLISHEVRGSIYVDDYGFGMDLVEARMGHLPMPGILRERLGKRVAQIFNNMTRERRVLDHSSTITIDRQRVRVST